MVERCDWANADALLATYHDREWGVPLHDDRRHFEFLVLDAMQAGLSWLTVLKKRDAFRRAFDGFDPRRVARFDEKRIEALMADASIVRNRAKIEAAVRNARAFLCVKQEFGSFDAYIWRFVDGEPRKNRFRRISQVPAKTKQSDAMSKDLIARNFSFVGSTICYAYMQAAGMVNDHLVDCHRYDRV
ncbi:MAG: DNA-3-methyladenine glycosylase I [bacterium]